jgi:hypothetical protein
MNYKGFLIEAFEQRPSKWRARIGRARGRPLISTNRRIREIIISVDQPSAAAALMAAMDAVDSDPLFHRKAEQRTERYWRVGAYSGQ